MTTVYLHLPDPLVADFRRRIGNIKTEEIVLDSVAFYARAVNEWYKGRIILSSEPDGTDLTVVTLAPNKSENIGSPIID